MTVSQPTFERAGDLYRFTFSEEQLVVGVGRLTEHKSQGLKAEIEITATDTGNLVKWGGLSLEAPGPRKQWVTDLEKVTEEVDWANLLEYICYDSVQRFRAGEAMVDESTIVINESRQRFLLPPFVSESNVSLFYGDGGAGKSALAMCAALAIATGLPILGKIPTRTGPVLYLDWETDRDDFKERIGALKAGLGIDPGKSVGIYYRRELGRLTDSARAVKQLLHETDAVATVVDSLGMARGGDVESSDLTIAMFAAFRTLGVPVLGVDHISKEAKKTAGRKNQPDPIGSIYTRNQTRVGWFARGQQAPGARVLSVVLWNTKFNKGAQPTTAFELDHVMEGEKLTQLDVRQIDPEEVVFAESVEQGGNTRQRIQALVRDNLYHPMTIGDMEDAFNIAGVSIDRATIRKTLSRHEGRSFVQDGDGWRLADSDEG